MSVLKFATPCENIHILSITFQPPKGDIEVAQIAYTDANKKRLVKLCYGYGHTTYLAIADGLANLEMETGPSQTNQPLPADEPLDMDFDLPAGDDAFIIPPHDQMPTVGA